MSLFSELKRRNIFKVGFAYLVVGWLIIQIIGSVAGPLNFPGWVESFVIVLVGVGFPIALLFAWAFELTADGLKRTEEVDESQSIRKSTGQKINYIIIGLMAVAIMVLVYDRGAVPDVSSAEPSIAVLAFEDFSPDGTEEYFADGISDEILNLLAKTRAMKVAGRTSSFSFKGKDDDIPTIAAKLNVEYLLEGSISKSANRVKITAQLNRADGYHVWSETYTRDLTDIFEIQEEIAAVILDELKITILGEVPPQLQKRSVDVALYNQYLLARELLKKLDNQSINNAYEILSEITRQDPTFAEAQAYLGIATLSSKRGADGNTGEIPFFEALRLAEAPIKLALEFGPDAADAHLAHCLLLLAQNKDAEGEQACVRAIELNPSYIEAKINLAAANTALSRHVEAFEIRKNILANDPISLSALAAMTDEYIDRMQLDEAGGLIDRMEIIAPDSSVPLNFKIQLLMLNSQHGEALHLGMENMDTIIAQRGIEAFNTGNNARILGFRELADRISPAPMELSEFFANGDYEQGLLGAEAYADQNPDDRFAPFWLANFEIALGNYERAREIFINVATSEGEVANRQCVPATAIVFLHNKLGNSNLAEPLIEICREKLAAFKQAGIMPQYSHFMLESILHFYDGDYEKGLAIIEQSYNVATMPNYLKFTERKYPVQELETFKRIQQKLDIYLAQQREIYLKLQAETEAGE